MDKRRNGARRAPRRALCFGATLVLICGCGGQGGITSDWRRIDPPVAALEFTLPQLDGKLVSLSDLRGRVVVMEFWATWCGPCRFSLPSLEVIGKRYRDQGVTVLLVNQGESAQQVRRWAKQRFTSPILLDENSRVGHGYGVRGMPRLVIVDQRGRVVYEHEGYGGGLEVNLSRILDSLLTEEPTPSHA